MMTYNWDNMVEITVPKGTNGWVYSGEVTINGVKVRFPVGTPTTVPEPAAALLNKMIELEREDDLSGAKPNNHYVGSVTVPDGKTLTLQKGAKVVDEAGVLGGGNAGGGVALVKVSCETTDMQTFTNITASKTYDELKAVYDADGLLWCRLTITMAGDGVASVECPVSAAQHDDDIKSFQFAPLGPISNMGIVVHIDGDGSLEVGVS